jgi:hypothetical protein
LSCKNSQNTNGALDLLVETRTSIEIIAHLKMLLQAKNIEYFSL